MDHGTWWSSMIIALPLSKSSIDQPYTSNMIVLKNKAIQISLSKMHMTITIKLFLFFFCQVQEKILKDTSFFFLSIGGLEGLN